MSASTVSTSPEGASASRPTGAARVWQRSTLRGLALGLPFALLVNGLLLFLIERLASGGDVLLSRIDQGDLVQFIRLQRRDETARQAPREPSAQRRERVTPPPAPSLPSLAKPSPPQPLAVPVPAPELALPQVRLAAPYLGEYLSAPAPAPAAPAPTPPVAPPQPLVQVAPLYPPQARRAGVEGVVTVEFTILADGTVSDPVIVAAEPPRIFDRAVLRAIKRWKFEPFAVDGQPIARRARKDIRFELR